MRHVAHELPAQSRLGKVHAVSARPAPFREGGGIWEEASGSGHLGGGMWEEASGRRHLLRHIREEAEASGSHLGSIWESSGMLLGISTMLAWLGVRAYLARSFFEL